MSTISDTESETQRSIVEDLSTSMIKQMSTIPFACGGSIGNIDNVQIRFGPQGSGSIVSLPIMPIEMSALHALLAASKPASFGRGNKEVIDETYRKATKLDTTEFLRDFCPYKAGIINVISQLLLPALEPDFGDIGSEMRGVEAQLYKLNVYSGPGGKFKPHVDTPRGDGQFGSLVVCLPLSHDGGELAVRHVNKEQIFDWSDKSTERTSHSPKKTKLDDDIDPSPRGTAKIQWAAFYSDCQHEVLEVRSGHRLTLTYNLYQTMLPAGRVADNKASPWDVALTSFYKELSAALSNSDFFEKGRVLAAGLGHAYAHTSKHLRLIPSALKGCDMYLYETCKKLGLQCFFRPVMQVEDRNEEDDRTHTWIGRDFVFREAGGMIDEGDPAATVAEVLKATKLDKCKVTWLRDESEYKEPNLSYTAYGNQAEGTTMYSSAAIFIVIPPFAERTAKVQQTQAHLSPLIQKDDRCTCSDNESVSSYGSGEYPAAHRSWSGWQQVQQGPGPMPGPVYPYGGVWPMPPGNVGFDTAPFGYH